MGLQPRPLSRQCCGGGACVCVCVCVSVCVRVCVCVPLCVDARALLWTQPLFVEQEHYLLSKSITTRPLPWLKNSQFVTLPLVHGCAGKQKERGTYAECECPALVVVHITCARRQARIDG